MNETTGTKILPKEDTAIAALQASLAEIELDVLTNPTLADMIRLGSTVTEQEYNWGTGETACALSAGYLAMKATGYIK